MSPTQRTLKLLREDGWTAEVVERWNPHSRIRQDLFGFVDIIAIKPSDTPRLLQVTSGTNVSARFAKMQEIEAVETSLLAGFDVFIHGWRKLKVKRGGKAVRWAPRILQIKIDAPGVLSAAPFG